jgi:hypothetical protein
MPCNTCSRPRRRGRELEPVLLPAWEVALLLSVHERTVRRMARRGQLAYEVLNASRGDYRLRRPEPGQRWIHPEGTFPPPPLPTRRRRSPRYSPTAPCSFAGEAAGR